MHFSSGRLTDFALAGFLIAGFAGSAVLAVIEVSLLRVRKTKVRTDASAGDRRAADLARLLDDLPVVLNTVLFVVLLLQVSVATITGYLAQRIAGEFWVTASSVVLSLLLFVYAEAIPKTMAVKSPYRSALRWARVLRILVRVFDPIVRRLVAFADWQMPTTATVSEAVSEPEFRLLARQSAMSIDVDTIAVADAELVERSFVFGDLQVADVMVPRDQIVAVSTGDLVHDALSKAIGAGHRRLPVLGESLDDVRGMVRLRDLAAIAGTASTVAPFVTSTVRCLPDELIADLMKRMRTSSSWLAIVHDEDGATLGLATVEDVVAELLGEIEEDPVRTMGR